MPIFAKVTRVTKSDRTSEGIFVRVIMSAQHEGRMVSITKSFFVPDEDDIPYVGDFLRVTPGEWGEWELIKEIWML